MLTGIIGAMGVEIEQLKKALCGASKTEYGNAVFYEGLLFGQRVVLAQAGIGKVHAAMCAQALILRYHPDLLINLGVAGALDERLDIGDIAVAQGLVQHDVDTSPIGDPVGMVSGPDLVYFPADQGAAQGLEKSAEALGIFHLTGVLATGDQFIASPDKKEWLHNEFHALTCDMEGAAIAQVAYEYAIPFAAYRAISDTLKGNGLEYSVNRDAAAAKSELLIRHFLEGLNHGI